MPGPRSPRALLPLLALLAAGPLAPAAHEDDPKALHRVPPVVAPGFRANPAHPSQAGDWVVGAGPGGFPSSDVSLLGWLPLSSFAGSPSSGNDCWGYTAPSGREYALFGHSEGLAVVEVSDPGNPQIIAEIAGPSSLWRDVKTYQDHAYVVSEGGSGIQVLDLSQVDAGVVQNLGAVTTGGTTTTHNVAIDEHSGFLYRCGGSNEGLRIYSLANPSAPAWVATWSDRYVHDAQIVTYTSGPYAGRQIAFCCAGFNGGSGQTALDIVDVTNKQNVFLVSRTFYSTPSYSHQGWLSTDRQVFYLNDELDEQNQGYSTRTRIVDVSDIDAPAQVGFFTTGSSAVDHNLYVRGNRIYEANYTSGLRVFDATNPLNPVEIAFFDTFPESDQTTFNGLWSSYPYFPSGIVIGSDLERGLFVWWVGPPQLEYVWPAGRPSFLDPAGESVPLTVVEASSGDLAPGSLRLHWNAGLGWQEAPLTPVSGTDFLADFPAAACGTNVAWYVSGTSTAGLTWNDPPAGAADPHEALAAFGQSLALEDDLEVASGWTAGAPGDDASTGLWTRANPIGTAAQPEDDHTPGAGVRCWFTGQGSVGGSVGENDVDGGTTTLLSPVWDVSGLVSPSVSYWRWYSNVAGASPGADTFRVDVSGNGGASWTTVEVVGPTGVEAAGGWFRHQFQVADLVAGTDLRLRFVASDLGDGSIVEAAVDDVQVFETDCGGCGTQITCAATPNSTGNPGRIATAGTTSVGANDLVLQGYDVPAGNSALFIYSPDDVVTPLGNGNLCVGNSTLGFVLRLDPHVIDLFGNVSHAFDNTAPPDPAGQVAPGETWYFQLWFRDPAAGGAFFDFSEGLRVTFCP